MHLPVLPVQYMFLVVEFDHRQSPGSNNPFNSFLLSKHQRTKIMVGNSTFEIEGFLSFSLLEATSVLMALKLTHLHRGQQMKLEHLVNLGKKLNENQHFTHMLVVSMSLKLPLTCNTSITKNIKIEKINYIVKIFYKSTSIKRKTFE